MIGVLSITWLIIYFGFWSRSALLRNRHKMYWCCNCCGRCVTTNAREILTQVTSLCDDLVI